MDRALDAAGGGALPALVELTGDPEHVVTIADYQGAQATGADSAAGWGPSGPCTRCATSTSDRGRRFSLPVARTFPLEEIAEAHRISEAGHVGASWWWLVD